MTASQLLSDIADIHTGFTFRGKVEESAVGDTHIVQIKDARSHWESRFSSRIAINALPKIQWQGKSHARAGSVLLPSRGEYFRAACLQAGEREMPVVASSQFFVINPKSGVLPEFLCWLLNQPPIQNRLHHDSRGSNIPMLNISMIGELRVPIPPISTQRHIIALDQLAEQERQLAEALKQNRQTQFQGIYQHLLKDSQS